jgi:hypothetical protein
MCGTTTRLTLDWAPISRLRRYLIKQLAIPISPLDGRGRLRGIVQHLAHHKCPHEVICAANLQHGTAIGS